VRGGSISYRGRLARSAADYQQQALQRSDLIFSEDGKISGIVIGVGGFLHRSGRRSWRRLNAKCRPGTSRCETWVGEDLAPA